ncbi:MAG: tetratricopeptide repeat protein [Bacteroidia bacterium]
MSTSSTISNSGRSLRITVIVLGILVCGMLFFADKTNLHNKNENTISTTSVSTGPVENVSSNIPPLAKDEKFDAWTSKLEEVNGAEKTVLLDSIVQLLTTRNRFEYAADYADQLAQTESSLTNRIQAGILSQKASQLEYVRSDSVLFRKYSQKAITYLSAAVEESPEAEDAKVYLGLSYVQSGLAENSMKGIMTLRNVLEQNPDNIEAGYYMGIFSLQTNQLEKAKERFEKILEVAPDYMPARLQLAQTMIRMEQPDKAKIILEELIRNREADDEIRLAARELINTLP